MHSVFTIPMAGCIGLVLFSLAPGCSRESPRDLIQDVLGAQRLEFVGEFPIPDGGSRVFHFVFPNRRELAIQVLHRNDYLGGNSTFQEIRMDWFGQMKNYVELQPGSEVEKKLLALLSSATCEAKGRPSSGWDPPTPQRLAWLGDRIRDRGSKW